MELSIQSIVKDPAPRPAFQGLFLIPQMMELSSSFDAIADDPFSHGIKIIQGLRCFRVFEHLGNLESS